MLKLFVSLAICLSFSFSAHAQSSSKGDRLVVGSLPRFVLSDIDERIVKRLKAAWHQCALGTTSTEAVVLVLREPDGSIKAVSAGNSHRAYEFHFRWNTAIIAVFHTHPNNRPPHPAEQDILVARKFDVPMFTLTGRGMFLYDPVTDRITKIKNGIDWLDSSSWIKNTHVAVDESPRR
jgi:hypothetical protein